MDLLLVLLVTVRDVTWYNLVRFRNTLQRNRLVCSASIGDGKLRDNLWSLCFQMFYSNQLFLKTTIFIFGLLIVLFKSTQLGINHTNINHTEFNLSLLLLMMHSCVRNSRRHSMTTPTCALLVFAHILQRLRTEIGEVNQGNPKCKIAAQSSWSNSTFSSSHRR